ncbi:Ciliary BBSome complex subunit 1 [Popillia japonica]|uniref:Ciliary BBSome complex subunit 1 n=1 Tax=Popillia japonica TaxID=7064 RepID=A0AAW1HU40_POPJA
MLKRDLNISRWLEAHIDRSASLTTLPKNLVLADVCGDGEYRLVLTDLKLENNEKSRLKVYKGTVLTSDQTLPDIPSSIISFYTSNYDSKIPVIGVACGPDLLIYKNCKPYFKFVVPPLPIEALEHSVWNRLSEDPNIDLKSTLDDLSSIPYNSLSPRSQKLLGLQTPTAIKDFISKYKSSEPKKFAPITCMATLNRSTQDKQSPACPVVATEAGQIFILDPQTFTPMHEAISCATKAIPCVLQAAGMYDVEFRIIIACRSVRRRLNSCLLRRGGAINFKILKRTADFNLSDGEMNSNPIQQTKPLPLPKRSKLFLEQSLRERQNAVDMHQLFQKDLIRLRLTAARATVQMQSNQSSIGNEQELVKLSAQVLGLGPIFTLVLTLKNMNNDKPLCGLSVVFHAAPTFYQLPDYLLEVPLIPPHLTYKIETKVHEKDAVVEDKHDSKRLLRVFVIRKGEAKPIVAAAINMPPTDLSFLL